MSRLQTKCAFASAGVHALLLALLVVSSAFVKPPPPPDPIHFVTIFNASQITDDETKGGGNPNVPSDATPPAPAPAAVIQQQPAEPPIQIQEPVKKPAPKVTPKKPPESTPEPPKIKEVSKPEPVVKESAKILKRDNGKKIVQKKQLTEKPPEVTKVEAPKHLVEVNLKVEKATADPEIQRRKMERERAAKEEKERAEAAKREAIRAQMAAVEQANREHKLLQEAFSGAVGTVNTGLARTTNVEMPGPGGEAFINYADLIWTKYYQAWQKPEDHEVRTPVKVEITVNRDGHIVSANVVKGSGDAALDRSVRQTLDRVHDLPAFPPGAKDPQRTFTINFYLKSKRSLG